MSWRFWVVLVMAVGIGLGLCWIDSRPGWDDTAVTAGAILVVTSTLGFAMPARPWVWAVAVGIWIPLVGITMSGNVATVLALIVALGGAYGGGVVRNALSRRPDSD